MSKEITVTIKTTKLNNYSQAMRAHISAANSYAKLQQYDQALKEADQLKQIQEQWINWMLGESC